MTDSMRHMIMMLVPTTDDKLVDKIYKDMLKDGQLNENECSMTFDPGIDKHWDKIVAKAKIDK